MKTIIVWYLISFGANYSTHWSPPLPTKEECQRIKTILYPANWDNRGMCLSVSEVVK